MGAATYIPPFKVSSYECRILKMFSQFHGRGSMSVLIQGTGGFCYWFGSLFVKNGPAPHGGSHQHTPYTRFYLAGTVLKLPFNILPLTDCARKIFFSCRCIRMSPSTYFIHITELILDKELKPNFHDSNKVSRRTNFSHMQDATLKDRT